MENLSTAALIDRAITRLPPPPAVPFFGASANLVVVAPSAQLIAEAATVRPGSREAS